MLLRALTRRSTGNGVRFFAAGKGKSSSSSSAAAAASSGTATATSADWTHPTTQANLPVTKDLHIVDTLQEMAKIPVFRVLSPSGKLLEGAPDPKLSKETAVEMYKMMLKIQALDDIFYNAQRQGRISFYMQNSGEESIHIGSASALKLDDMILAQYREVGVLLWRGFTLQQCADQCFSNEKDLGKGRQMPVHYGSKDLNFQTISSPLTTQLPQAAGVAYAQKLSKADACTVVYFGEGAASEGDFHAAMNFASTLEVPLIFFCRNNGYAISTPTQDQFHGDGIASRAVGYGMHCIRVDGNDIIAVKQATEAARKLAIEKCCPVFIEAMSYRRGHHSTSDDSTRYRSQSEITHWQDSYDPVARFRTYIEDKGWWNSEFEMKQKEEERAEVLAAMEVAEGRKKPPVSELFEDVYAEKPAHILRQEQQLQEHIAKYADHYNKDGAH